MTNAELHEDNRKLRARCVMLNDQLNQLQQEVDSLKASQPEPEARSPLEYDAEREIANVPITFCDKTFALFVDANKFLPFYGMAMVKADHIEIHRDNPLMLRRR
jgi:hypothetical protein